MAITQGLCNSFKTEIFAGTHNMTNSTGDAFLVALFTSAATLSASTTAYAATGEASGTGYTAGGQAVTTTSAALSGSTALVSFNNVTWASSTITARGCLIYNSSKSNKAVVVLDFGADKTSSNGNFTIQMPANTIGNAIISLT